MYLSWQQIPSPLITEILSRNFDGVVLDTEHGVFNCENLITSIQVLKLQNKKSFVRLTEVSKTLIRYCLDAGVDGLIFSTIETEQQCLEIRDCCFYPPRGKRGFGLVRENHWGQDQFFNREPVLIAQIETKLGIENLKIIKNFNFDYYLIGPYDLSMSLGIPNQFDNELFLSYISKVNKIIDKSKLAIHVPKDVERHLHKYRDYGLMCLGMDTIALTEYHKGIIKND